MRRLLPFVSTLFALASSPPAGAQTGVSDDRVSLPDGPGSQEGVGDDAAINANMGQLTFGFPVRLPAGFAGATPDVALTYSSGIGAGIAGVGWSMDLPFVERRSVMGVPRYDADDELQVSGQQLVHVSGSSPREYRARVEGGFARYQWHGADDGKEGYWVALLPDGSKAWYGADPDGEPVAAARVGGVRGTLRWHLVAQRDVWGHDARYSYADIGLTEGLPTRIDWVRVGDVAQYSVTFSYQSRDDWLIDAAGGVEDVMDQRLTEIAVISRGATIRRYSLDYDPPQEAGGFSRLQRVRTFGLLDAEYPVATTFRYSLALGEICRASGCERPFVASMGSIERGLQNGDATLVDINGDALPDIVDTSVDGKHQIFVNVMDADGSATFAAAADSGPGTRGGHRLSNAYVQVLDANGDGFTDMMNASTGRVLLNRGGGDWDEEVDLFAAGAGLPNTEAQMRALRFLDYDNDRRIDLVGSSGTGAANVTTVYRNTGVGFAVDDQAGPIGLGFNTNRLELNDINGDGLLDVAIVVPTKVRYRLNLGRGRWTGDVNTWSEMDLDTSLTNEQAAAAELEDINGDGLADLTLVTGTQVRLWVNRNGRQLDPETTITSADLAADSDALPALDDVLTTVLFADINGNGSSDVVWVSGDGDVSYLDLFPQRPNLITRIDNGLGGVIDVTWTTSVREQARDAAKGAGWQHKLPFPNAVVASIHRWDRTTGASQIQELTYHDGFYDGSERMFRGFAEVEQRFAGGEGQEPARFLLGYDVGAGSPHRAGLQLTAEILGAGDRSIQRIETTYDLCRPAGVPDDLAPYRVLHPCPTKTEVSLREGRPPSEWVTLRRTRTFDGHGNVIDAVDEGVVTVGGGGCASCDRAAGEHGAPCGASCQGDERYVTTQYVQPDKTDGAWILGRPIRVRESAAAVGDVYAETITRYDGDAFVGLPEGELTHGYETRVIRRLDDGGGTIDSARYRRDLDGNVVAAIGPGGSVDGHAHRAGYEMTDDGLRVAAREHLLEDADGAPYTLRQEVRYDPVWDLPSLVQDWAVVRGGEALTQKHTTSYAYDEHGRLSSTVLPGDDTLAQPTARYEYFPGAPSRVVTRKRSAAGGPEDIVQVTCKDGRDRAYQSREFVGDGTWQVSGYEVLAASGEPRASYQPWQSTSEACEAAPPDRTLATEYERDALARPVSISRPGLDDVQVETLTYAPLRTFVRSPEDNHPQSPHHDTPEVNFVDGLGRLVAVARDPGGGAPPERYTFTYDGLGSLFRLTDPLGNTRTQTSDLLGRIVRVEDPDRGVTAFELDAAGRVITETDALGVTIRRRFDGLGRLAAEWIEGAEADTRVELLYDLPEGCATSAPCANTANRKIGARFPTALGEARESYRLDARGRAREILREVGGVSLSIESEYDNADRLVRLTYPGGVEVPIRWDSAERVRDIPGYVDRLDVDARGDVAEVRFANGVTLTQVFDERRGLASIDLLDPDDAVLIRLGFVRDALQRVIEVDDLTAAGDALSLAAVYAYDALGRLGSAALDPGADQGESVSYAYDAADNLVSRTSSRGPASPVHDGERTIDAGRPHAVAEVGGVALGYDAAGALVQRGDEALEWDGFGRLVAVRDGAGAALSERVYGVGADRVWSRSGEARTWHLGPNFVVEDGVGEVYVKLGDAAVARHEVAATAPLVLSDIAPASGAGALRSAPDGLVNSADAWLAYAADRGLVTWAAETKASPVAELLASSARQGLIDFDERVTFLHRDHLDSLIAVTDEGGAVVERSLRYPFGAPRWSSTNAPEPLAFTSQRSDPAAGLVSMGLRDYDPLLARWISPDEAFVRLSEDQLATPWEAFGAYSYVRNNPVGWQDETGATTEPRRFDRAAAEAAVINLFLAQYQQHRPLTAAELTAARRSAEILSVVRKGAGPMKGGWQRFAIDYVAQHRVTIQRRYESRREYSVNVEDRTFYKTRLGQLSQALRRYDDDATFQRRLRDKARAPVKQVFDESSIDDRFARHGGVLPRDVEPLELPAKGKPRDEMSRRNELQKKLIERQNRTELKRLLRIVEEGGRGRARARVKRD